MLRTLGYAHGAKPSRRQSMRKLAIALGASLALFVAGAIVWKADATTWRSGTFNLPGVTKNYSPIEQVGCYGYGDARPDTNGNAKTAGAGASPASLSNRQGRSL